MRRHLLLSVLLAACGDDVGNADVSIDANETQDAQAGDGQPILDAVLADDASMDANVRPDASDAFPESDATVPDAPTMDVETSPDAPTMDVKTSVLALFGTAGRTSGAPLRVLTSANAPAGVSVNDTTVTISLDGATLSDFSIEDKTVFVNADNVTIQQCSFRESVPQGGGRIIDIRGDAKGFLIAENDFEGWHGLGQGVTSAIFQRPLTTREIDGVIRGNRLWHLGQDGIKTSGGVTIEENVLYAFSNVDTQPIEWDSGTTYAAGAIVRRPGAFKHFRSLVGGNRNRSLPTSDNPNLPESRNANWNIYDPHYDMVNPFENTEASTIRRNLFLIDNQDSLIPAAERSWAIGAVNALRLVRNGRNSTQYVTLRIEENVIYGNTSYGVGFPIQAACAADNWMNPTLVGNYVDDNNEGSYAYSSTASCVDWHQNFDTTTCLEIPSL